MFRIFDTNNDKVINFREFIITFATFLNETIDKQIKLSFKIYDPKDKGFVTKDSLKTILKDAVKGLGTCILPDELLDEIVEDTFKEMNKFYSGSPLEGDTNTVTFEMYEKMVYENNDIIKWLAIDLHRVCQGAKLILSDKARIKNLS